MYIEFHNAQEAVYSEPVGLQILQPALWIQLNGIENHCSWTSINRAGSLYSKQFDYNRLHGISALIFWIISQIFVRIHKWRCFLQLRLRQWIGKRVQIVTKRNCTQEIWIVAKWTLQVRMVNAGVLSITETKKGWENANVGRWTGTNIQWRTNVVIYSDLVIPETSKELQVYNSVLSYRIILPYRLQ